jgi:hypothetical protein
MSLPDSGVSKLTMEEAPELSVDDFDDETEFLAKLESSEKPVYSFKRKNFEASSKLASGKRQFKKLPQITALDHLSPHVTCLSFIHPDSVSNLFTIFPCFSDSSISAPPSFIPARAYCDITGLRCLYVDPKSKLRYHSSRQFSVIQNTPDDMAQSCLSIRGNTKSV